MAVIFCNGCFDLFHPAHRVFLSLAKGLGHRGGFTQYADQEPLNWNRLIVAINSDESAKRLKHDKWGANYPRDSQEIRAQNVCRFADEVVIFNYESELHDLIERYSPCILCKGPDSAGRENEVTGSDIAPVIILDTPETEEIRELKRKAYML